MADAKKTTIYITLVCIGVVLTTLFVMMLTYNVRVFVLLLILYLIAFSIYTFVFLMIKRNTLKDDIRYDIANYTSLFNIFFGSCIFILGVVFLNRTPGYSTPSYRY